MTRSNFKLLLAAVAALFFCTLLAVAATGGKISIFTDAILPDGQEIKAGQYQVAVNATENEITFLKGKTVVAKHACKCLGHEGPKHEHAQARFTATPDNKQKLTEIQLAGSSCILSLEVKEGM